MRHTTFPPNHLASLGNAAYKNTGNTPGTVAVGDDDRFSVVTCTVGALPGGQSIGKRGFVTDNSGSLAISIGTIATGGGSDAVPVYFDGADWRVG